MKHGKVVSARLSDTQREKIVQIAKIEDRSVGQVVRHLLEEALENRGALEELDEHIRESLPDGVSLYVPPRDYGSN